MRFPETFVSPEEVRELQAEVERLISKSILPKTRDNRGHRNRLSESEILTMANRSQQRHSKEFQAEILNRLMVEELLRY